MGTKGGDATGFAKALKRLREQAGLSQAQLAEKAGLNVFGVAKLEQGVREPGWSTVLKLASALGVECTAFSDREDVSPDRQTDKPGNAMPVPKKPAAKKKK